MESKFDVFLYCVCYIKSILALCTFLMSIVYYVGIIKAECSAIQTGAHGLLHCVMFWMILALVVYTFFACESCHRGFNKSNQENFRRFFVVLLLDLGIIATFTFLVGYPAAVQCTTALHMFLLGTAMLWLATTFTIIFVGLTFLFQEKKNDVAEPLLTPEEKKTVENA